MPPGRLAAILVLASAAGVTACSGGAGPAQGADTAATTASGDAAGPTSSAEGVTAGRRPRALVVYDADDTAGPGNGSPLVTVPIDDLEVGDCVNLPGIGMPGTVSIDRAELVECSDPHGAEIYALVGLATSVDEPFPGDAAAQRRADEACLAAFEPYVGRRYVDTPYEIVHMRPHAEAWVRGEQELTCAIVNADLTPLTGSVARPAG